MESWKLLRKEIGGEEERVVRMNRGK
jgi:hypothetical protein